MTEITRVGAADFSAEEDLPIGQVLRRFGERRLGLATEDNALTVVQERLAGDMASRAANVTARNQTSAVSRRRPLHLDVGSRYLPLRVDAGFGRFGAFEHQDLMPKGNWVYQLDADLLRLWVEEELELEAEAQGWIRAETLAVSRRTPEMDRQPARPSGTPGRRTSRIGTQLPPAVRKSLAPHREQVRQAVLAAVRGDTSSLAQMTHGSAVAKRLLAKIEANRRAKTPIGTQATARTVTGTPPAATQAPVIGNQPALPRFAGALEHDDLIALRDELPMLAVDASEPSFSFEGAARTVMATARAAVQTAQQTAAATTTRPASIATRALSMARTAQRQGARMFGQRDERRANDEAQALSITPFMPKLAELAPGPEQGISIADDRVEENLYAIGTPRAGQRATEFGSQALKALKFDARAARSDSPDVSTFWLMEGGRGVLLAGLDGDDAAAANSAAWESPSADPIQDTPARTTVERLARAMAATMSPAILTTSTLGAQIAAPAAAQAHQRGPAISLELPSLAATQAAAPVRDRQTRQPAAQRLTIGVTSTSDAIATRAFLPVGGTDKPIVAPSVQSYDATGPGDFAQVVARNMVRQLQTRLPDAARTVSASTPTNAPVARPPERARSGARVAILQDVVVSSGYLPTLVRSIAEVQRAARAIGRLNPSSLATAAPPSAPVARRTEAGVERLSQVVARLGRLMAPATTSGLAQDLLNTRAATAATELAQAIREARTSVTPEPQGSIAGYDGAGWWGVDNVLLEMERAADSAAGTFTPWQHDAEPQAFARIERAVEAAAQKARTTVVAQLAQLTKATQEAARTARPVQARATSVATSGALRLFSPEKTVALIAPELESGGLLDVGARRALSEALETLSQASASSVQTRSVRTPFGTLKVRLDHGKIVVDTEEISANAPVVSVATDHQGSAANRRTLTTAPTRTARLLAQTVAPEPGAPSTPRFAAGAMASALERTLPQVLSTMQGVSARLDVLLGGPARAEVSSHHALGDLVEAATAVTRARQRLGTVLDAPPSEMTGRFAALAKTSAPLATSRLDAAGDVIRLFAGSDRAARVIQTLSAGGFATTGGDLLGPDTQLPAAQPAQIDRATPAAIDATSRTQLGTLGRALATIGTARAGRVARVLHDLSQGRDVALPVAARTAESLGELLAEAADARSIGTLGQVGMARQVAPGMSRADLAYILPYTQRATAWGIPAAAEWAGESGAPGGQLASPASSLLELAVSLGRGQALLDGVDALNLSAAGTAGPANAPLADTQALSAHPGRIGLGLASAGHSEASGAGYLRVAGQEHSDAGTFVSPARAISRSLATREARRFERMETAIGAPASVGERPSRRARAGVLRPRALSAGVLRNLLQVRSALDGLGSRPQAASGPRLQVGTQPTAGALVAPERRQPGAADVRWRGGAPALDDATAERPSATGTTGVWMPAGAERLMAESTDAIVSGRASIAGSLVAPRLLTPQKTRTARSAAGTRSRPQQAGSPRGRAVGIDAVARQVAMGLRSLQIPGMADAARGESAGSLLAVGAGAGALNASPWLTSTRSQDGARKLAATLGIEWVAPGTGRAQSAAGVDLPSPEFVSPGPSPDLGSGPGALFSPPASKPRPRARAARAPGELFTPPAPPAPPTPETYGPSGTQAQESVAPRAARTQDASGGMVERAEAEDRTGLAHQSGVPSQENIEDIAYEVLSELKRRWSYELERRGTE